MKVKQALWSYSRRVRRNEFGVLIAEFTSYGFLGISGFLLFPSLLIATAWLAFMLGWIGATLCLCLLCIATIAAPIMYPLFAIRLLRDTYRVKLFEKGTAVRSRDYNFQQNYSDLDSLTWSIVPGEDQHGNIENYLKVELDAKELSRPSVFIVRESEKPETFDEVLRLMKSLTQQHTHAENKKTD